VLPQPHVRPTLFCGHPIAEHRWQLEVLELLADPVWRGNDVPRGDGAPVLLVPGFLGGDLSLSLLRGWLRRVGYRSYRADICWNVDCAERAVQRLERRLQHVVGRTGRPVVVVGHSRGGLFGRALATRTPRRVAQVITLGSPLADQFDCAPLTAACIAGARAVQYVLHPGARRDGCFTRDCRCAFTSDLVAPLSPVVPLTSIYTPDDGIVRPSACRPADAECIAVRGSHLGLGVNADVYRHLGLLLAAGSKASRREVD
jgi:pimeloyl-ACP methyl ester carboxylesterase